MDGIAIFPHFEGITFENHNTIDSSESFSELLNLQEQCIRNALCVVELINRVLKADSAVLLQQLGKLAADFVLFDVIANDNHDESENCG